MKFGAIVAIFLGLLIILSVTHVLPSFSFAVEIFLAIVFLYNGFKVFRRFKAEHMGSLIFGAILVVDLLIGFNIIKNFRGWGFWELVVAMIGSYIVGWGIVVLFRKSFFRVGKEPSSTRQTINVSRPEEFGELDVELEANLTKVLLMDNSSNGIDANISFDKLSFNGNLQYNMDKNRATLKAKCKAKAGVSSVLSKSRMNMEISSRPLLRVEANLDGADTVLDFSNLNLDRARVKTSLSRLSIIPSTLRDCIIDIDCEVTSLNIRVPKDVGISIVHEGELNWSNFNNLMERERGYVSTNIDRAISTCQINVKSDMSKISIDWI